jgi:sugar phosphate isomerase/epimerase
MHTSISRRTFLSVAGALPFAASSLSAFQPKGKVPVGLELYSVRNALMKDLPGTVTAVAKMGYEVVEFYSPYFQWTPDAAKDVRKLLDDLGIKCRSTHNGRQSFTEEGLKKAIELNQIIGSTSIVLAGPGQVSGVDGWKALTDTLAKTSEQLRAHNMTAGFHNHQLEWKPVDGQRPMDIIAKGTPKDFTLQLDVGTAVEVGVDPVGWITSNPGRIRSMHCKDWAAGGRGYGVAFGEGDAPWKRIFEAAEATGGIEFYLIEQEHPGEITELEMARKCLDNYRKLRTT